MARPLRRSGAMPKSRRQARIAPPRADQGRPRGASLAAVQEFWLAVVVMVRVAVTAVAPVMLTGVVAPKLSVGTCCAPDGLAVMEAVSATQPVNPLAGVTVTSGGVAGG